MNTDEFIEIYKLGCSEGISGKELNKKFSDLTYNDKICFFLKEEAKDTNNLVSSPVKLNVWSKAVYTYRDSRLAPSLEKILLKSKKLSEDDLYNIIGEVEFSLTLLGILNCPSSINILKYYAEDILSWDDLMNVNKAAIYSIAKIGGDYAYTSLTQLSKHKEGVISSTAKLMLKKHQAGKT